MDYKKEIKEEKYLRVSKMLPESRGGIGRPGEANKTFSRGSGLDLQK